MQHLVRPAPLQVPEYVWDLGGWVLLAGAVVLALTLAKPAAAVVAAP
jgi:hypothetical protein